MGCTIYRLFIFLRRIEAVWKVQRLYCTQNADEHHSIFVTYTGEVPGISPGVKAAAA